MKIKFLFAVIISLFVSGLVSAQGLPFTAPPTKGYLLGPGDEVSVRVLGEQQFDFVAIVNEDGKIEVPFSETQINAKCRSEKELRTDVSSLLGKFLKDPQLGLQVKKNSRPPAMIYGEVNVPTKIDLYRKATLMEFISQAGGIKEEAGGTIQIFRTTSPMCADPGDDSNWKSGSSDPTDVPSRIYSLANLRLGKEDSNPVIIPGDVIFVHRAIPVYVTGEVIAPQGIYLKEGGLSLTEAIAKIGGLKEGAKTKAIKVYRLKPNADPESIKGREELTANYDMIKKGLEKDIMLRPNDIVEVGKAKDTVGMQIFKFAIGAGKAVVTAGSNSIGYKVLY